MHEMGLSRCTSTTAQGPTQTRERARRWMDAGRERAWEGSGGADGGGQGSSGWGRMGRTAHPQACLHPSSSPSSGSILRCVHPRVHRHRARRQRPRRSGRAGGQSGDGAGRRAAREKEGQSRSRTFIVGVPSRPAVQRVILFAAISRPFRGHFSSSAKAKVPPLSRSRSSAPHDGLCLCDVSS